MGLARATRVNSLPGQAGRHGLDKAGMRWPGRAGTGWDGAGAGLGGSALGSLFAVLVRKWLIDPSICARNDRAQREMVAQRRVGEELLADQQHIVKCHHDCRVACTAHSKGTMVEISNRN